MLVPKEMKVEQTGGIKAMTDEQLEAGIAALQDLLQRRALAAQGKLIEGSIAPPAVVEDMGKDGGEPEKL
jgi:hypothetical protein